MKVYWLLWLLMLCLWFQHVFEYFTERTPRSHFEVRETSLVWNYKYAGTRNLYIYICTFFLLVKIFWLCCVCYFVHLLINLCKNVTTTLDIEFGRLQARDMLQHLWTGPISNASVDVIQGGRSVEVRAVGVTKVAGSLFITVLCFFVSHVILFATRKKITCQYFIFNDFMCIQGAAIDRILGEIVHYKGMKSPIDYVLCIGHFIAKVCFH